MHVTWLIPGAVEQHVDKLYSSMASVRYRVLFVAEHLANLGNRVDLVCEGALADSSDLETPLSADVVIVSKGLFDESVPLAERAKRLGAHLLMDICDDHFSTQFSDTYFALCELADGIIASTPGMARVIQERTGRAATVIDDPFEAAPGDARFAPTQDAIKLLWFGHPTNFDTLAAMIPDLVALGREQPVALQVVSQDDGKIRPILANLSAVHTTSFTARFTAWTQDATWQAIDDCDIVVIPSLPSAAKLIKSPNRMVESIRRGRFVAAYPLPSYQAFAKYAWLGEDVCTGIRWAISHPGEALCRIKAGQHFVAEQFAPNKLASRWESVIRQYAGRRLVGSTN